MKRLLLVICAGLALACQPASPPPSQTPTEAPQRIVSLIPSATELIFEVGAGDRLVGVTTNDDFPPEVENLPKVGDESINYDILASLNPDLVVLDSAFNKELKLDVEILALRSDRLDDIPKNLRLLGRALGLERQGEKAALQFEKELEALEPLTESKTVFIEIWGSPLMTCGSQTLPDDLLRQLGLVNCYGDQTGYFQIVNETLAQRSPDIILLPAEEPGESSAAAAFLAKLDQHPRVISIDASLIAKPTPRVIEGLKILKNSLL